MSRPDLVSVIVPVRDAVTTLPLQLAQLAAQSYDGAWEVVIADNGSTDGSPEVGRAWKDRIARLRVVDASAKPGANHARNTGVAAAHGDFIAFCDADDEVSPGWLGSLVVAARDVDMVGGWLDRERLNTAVTRAWRMSDMSHDSLPVALGFRPYVLSGNCGIWRSVLEDVGGWNEEYKGCTDVELSWRVQFAGYRLGFAPDAVVHYRFRASLKGLARQFTRIGIAEVRLYRDFHQRGLQRDRHALRSWIWLLVHAPRALWDATWRGLIIRNAARRFGRLWGSAREGVLFP
jgi:glycosyltransferase involved in cell wall biosynthesis